MSTTTDTTTHGADMSGPSGGGPLPKDPYIRGTDETVLLDLRELRAQAAEEKAAREAGMRAGSALEVAGAAGVAGVAGATGGALSASGAPGAPGASEAPGAELERYHGSHRRDAVLYADGGTAIPLDRVREVCHDLRQPVAAILMLASAAELRPDVPERVRDVLQEIMAQTEEISATVRQFLDDAKQGVDGLGEPVPCNVAGLAAESVERWRATFDGDLALAAAEDPLHVTVDPVLFKRALGNVLSNGTRAAGDAGRVQVTVRRFETAQGERAVIEVDDNGPGFGNIPAGHGLGLAVVRRTIEAAGGSVELAEGPLGGALVRLVLPVTPIRPLSANDELTRTFHGEISLTQLAAELAAGGVQRALADFDDDFDDFDDDLDGFDDDLDEDLDGEFDGAFAGDPAETEAPASVGTAHASTPAAHASTLAAEAGTPVADASAPAVGGHSLTGGHAVLTRLSAWPEPMAISGTPEQLAIGGPAESANPFAARAAAAQPVENRSYFGLPPQPTAADEQPGTDRGFFAPAAKPADTGYFGLPLKNDEQSPAPTRQTPDNRLYAGPAEIAAPNQADISAHPVPAGLLSPRRTAPTSDHAAPVAPQTSMAAPAEIATAPTSDHAAPVAPQTSMAAPAEIAAAPTAGQAFPAAYPAGAPASPLAAKQASGSVAPAEQAPVFPTPAEQRPAAAAPAPAPAPAEQTLAAPAAPASGHAAAPAPASTEQASAAPADQAPAAAPAPTYDPSDTQPLHIIPTGQDDTALASIQLPSQATLTHPPRIPASALQPVASVQLSLLPGGAF